MRRGLGAAALERIAPHVTVVPPVNVRDDGLDQATAVLRQAARDSGPLRLHLGPPRTFWPASPVVYLAVGGDVEELRTLRQAMLVPPLDTSAGRRAEREYVPHVTLDQSIEVSRIDPAIETLSAYRASVTIEQLTLLRFEETERAWLPFASAALGRPRTVGRGGLEIELSFADMLEPEADRFQAREWSQYAIETYGDERGEETFAITARIGGEIAGTATGQLRSDYCRLANLMVAAHLRSHGVGSQLLRATEQVAREHNIYVVRLETRAGGAAERFYAERGYVVAGTLARWRRGHDFSIMERSLAAKAQAR